MSSFQQSTGLHMMLSSCDSVNTDLKMGFCNSIWCQFSLYITWHWSPRQSPMFSFLLTRALLLNVCLRLEEECRKQTLDCLSNEDLEAQAAGFHLKTRATGSCPMLITSMWTWSWDSSQKCGLNPCSLPKGRATLSILSTLFFLSYSWTFSFYYIKASLQSHLTSLACVKVVLMFG